MFCRVEIQFQSIKPGKPLWIVFKDRVIQGILYVYNTLPQDRGVGGLVHIQIFKLVVSYTRIKF